MIVREKKVNFITERGGLSKTGWFMDYVFSGSNKGYRVLYSYGTPIVIMHTEWDDKNYCMKPIYENAIINLEKYKASKTTGKHRCLMLEEGIKETESGIRTGYYYTVRATEQMIALITTIKGGELI